MNQRELCMAQRVKKLRSKYEINQAREDERLVSDP